jgi:hypothetical protein
VRQSVPSSTAVSAALGEVSDWVAPRRRAIDACCWDGIVFRKLGLAHAGPSWRDHRRDVQGGMNGESAAGPGGAPLRVAVADLDREAARASGPESVIGEAASIGDCLGVRFDTWDRSRRIEFDPNAARWTAEARDAGRFVVLAGSLGDAAIRRLRPLEPDFFAVRGAAHREGDRNGPTDRDRVAHLAEAVAGQDCGVVVTTVTMRRSQ